MGDVSRLGTEAGRAVPAVRRLVGARDLPVAVAGLLGLISAIEVLTPTGGAREQTSIALVLGLCSTVPLTFIRTHALAVLVTITSATVLTVVVTGHRPPVAGLVAQVGVAGLLGSLLVRQARAAAARRAASRLVAADTLVEFAARGERARIARELHDVVAHHLSMISLQAEAARLSTPDLHPEGARRLAGIGDTARSALTEMRRLLGVLRDDAGATPSLTPQPGLEQLNGLIDEVRTSSRASTRLIVRGHVAPLDPGVELTAYRIVQEALTNARRHAPGAAVDVELTYTADALRLRVRDNGPATVPGTATPVAGLGLLGMRERAAMVGGALSTGPAPGCGFLVEARLPTTAEIR